MCVCVCVCLEINQAFFLGGRNSDGKESKTFNISTGFLFYIKQKFCSLWIEVSILLFLSEDILKKTVVSGVSRSVVIQRYIFWI